MNQLASSNISTVETISKDCDFVLDVGNPVARRLKVSSKVLTAASRYFEALLGPHFREGQTLIQSGTVIVPTPEDDPQAMSDMCNLLHGRSIPELLSQSILASRILHLAITLDKVCSPDQT
jgi:hypothetical protein